MREQLIQYVNLLFAGAPDCDEVRAEILQNTLDRYDDLLEQGKSPEAAYRLAISGIGDVNEILGMKPVTTTSPAQKAVHANHPETEDDIKRKKIRAAAIAMYIVCAIPLFILSDLGVETLGLTLTILLVACATYLMIITGKKDDIDEDEEISKKHEFTPKQELKRSIGHLIGVLGLAFYLIVSFLTGAWYITWIIFPIIGCVKGLINAIIDLREVQKNEK